MLAPIKKIKNKKINTVFRLCVCAGQGTGLMGVNFWNACD